jgi:hypothetical protein
MVISFEKSVSETLRESFAVPIASMKACALLATVGFV